MHQQTAALVAWPRGDGAEVSMVDAFRDANGELLGRRLSRAELGGERRGSASGSLLEPWLLTARAQSRCRAGGTISVWNQGQHDDSPTWRR